MERPAGDMPDEEMGNDRFRRLVERSVYLSDPEATDELSRYFLSKLHKKANAVRIRFGAHEVEDLVKTLTDKAFHVAYRTVVKRVDFPRNYVIRAVSLTFIDELHKIEKRCRNEGGTFSDSAEVDAGFLHVENKEVLEQFKMSRSKASTDFKVAQVIQLTYLLDVTPSAACDLLDFGKAEQERVTKMLQRWRAGPTTPLSQFRNLEEGGGDV